MANLIPPDAKRAIVIEYWLRVVTVWFVLIGIGFIVIALLKAPTFVLLQTQLNVFSGAYDEAQETEVVFTEAQQTILDANGLSLLLTKDVSAIPFTEIIDILDTIAGGAVTISDFTLERTEAELNMIVVRGVADTRISLANFSKDIEAHELFTEAAVPLSNLAKDKDIIFAITIVPTSQ